MPRQQTLNHSGVLEVEDDTVYDQLAANLHQNLAIHNGPHPYHHQSKSQANHKLKA